MRLSAVRLPRWSLPFATLIALVTLLVPGRLDGAGTWLVSFTIDDTFPNAKVTSDLGSDVPYPDWRLPQVAGDFQCIEATVSGTGFFATLNRKIDAAGTRCNPVGSDRQFHVHVTDSPLACQKLGAAYPDGVVHLSATECKLLWTANPRIRVTDLFKGGRATSTPLALLNDKAGVDGLSYEIQTLTNVSMLAESTDRRVLTYAGQAILSEFGSGKPRPVEDTFDLNLRMVFDRFPQ